MRILQVVADGAVGGGTNHVLAVTGGLASDSIPMGIVTDEGSALEKISRDRGYPVFTGRLMSRRINAGALRLIRRAIKEFEPDVIHCHGGRSAFYRSFVPDAVPTVYTVHGYHFRRRSAVWRLVGRLAERWSCRFADSVIFVCRADQEFAFKQKLFSHDKRSQVIYNGVSLPSSCVRADEAAAVGFVGRFVREKHPELFVQMMSHLPNAVGVMVGGGELEESVRKEISRYGMGGRLELTGGLAHEVALERLSKFAALVMTSRSEGMPLLLLEAMARRIPVVSTAVGGIPEIIEHNVSGLLAEETAESLAAAVLRIQGDAALRSRLIHSGHAKVENLFNEQRMLQLLKSLYQSCCKSQAVGSAAAAASR